MRMLEGILTAIHDELELMVASLPDTAVLTEMAEAAWAAALDAVTALLLNQAGFRPLVEEVGGHAALLHYCCHAAAATAAAMLLLHLLLQLLLLLSCNFRTTLLLSLLLQLLPFIFHNTAAAAAAAIRIP